MDRVILHSDLNNFYASVECFEHPELRDVPMAVSGNPEARHGIILSKNMLAKKYQVKTAETIWEAKRKCPDLVTVPPNFPLYMQYASLVRKIYLDYTPYVEPFGIDEAWLDVTGCPKFRGNGKLIADEIRKRIAEELGLTVSIGVSFNKVFAKLGSDLRKPDATNCIARRNFKRIVWPLPASDLLYVGRSTTQKLLRCNIKTIGDIANSNPVFLRSILGKWGELLWGFANGLDRDPVKEFGESSALKSIGNSTTTPRDLKNNEDVKMILYVLAESVAERLRDHHLKCRTVEISVRDTELHSIHRQGKLSHPSALSSELFKKAYQLFLNNYQWIKPIRSLGVRAVDLSGEEEAVQLSFMEEEKKAERMESLEETVDSIRRRFGHFSIGRAVLLQDKKIYDLNPKDDHIIFPAGYEGEKK